LQYTLSYDYHVRVIETLDRTPPPFMADPETARRFGKYEDVVAPLPTHAPENGHVEHHDHEIEHPDAERRAKIILAAGAIGSVALATFVEAKAGITKEMHGLVSNALHNYGDGLIHMGRAAGIAARLAGRNARNKLIRKGSAVAMAAVTGLSLYHTGEVAADLWDHPEQALTLSPMPLHAEALMSVGGNAGIAVTLALGTRRSSVHAETASHSGRDVVEAIANTATTINPVAGFVGGIVANVWGGRLAKQMWQKAKSQEEVTCGHAHHAHEEHETLPQTSAWRERVHDLNARFNTSLTMAAFDATNWLRNTFTQTNETGERRVRRGRVLAVAGLGVLAVGGAVYVRHRLGIAGSGPSHTVAEQAPLPKGQGHGTAPAVELPQSAPPVAPRPPVVIELPVYNRQTGLGTVYQSALEHADRFGHGGVNGQTKLELVRATLAENGETWQTAPKLPPGRLLRMLSEEQMNFIVYVNAA
jgi:hypothetical protein